MRRLVLGGIHADYAQIYVESDPDGDGLSLLEALTGTVFSP
ncbi:MULTISPECIES: hypothetical protein [Streptomyces]|nr:hypothetical protein [Streptomyces ardesiacus]